MEQGLRFQAEGADIVDVGGESTRPGSAAVDAEEEMRRILPVIRGLASRLDIPISVDTYKSAVARAAIDAGASIINDVWGLKHDPDMAPLAAKEGVPVVLMHNQNGIDYADLVPDVMSGLRSSLSLALEAGVPIENVILDPGMGFGKTAEHNLEILRRLAGVQGPGKASPRGNVSQKDHRIRSGRSSGRPRGGNRGDRGPVRRQRGGHRTRPRR